MQIIDYKYIHGSEQQPGYIAIPELKRLRPSATQFIKLANLDITLTRPTAFLYIDGFSVSPSDSGLSFTETKNYAPAIKGGVGNTAHSWVHTFKGKEHLVKVDIISSTCAASIQAIYEANQLLYSGIVDEVILIGGERITDETLRLFRELKIPLTCGDGFAYMRLGRGSGIDDCKWKYAYNRNPFTFEREVIDTLIPEYPVDFVKLHGTGTETNNAAEAGLEEIGTPIKYKPRIGHTQGISGLVETCMALEDDRLRGTILVTANGLGGFYGAFTLTK